MPTDVVRTSRPAAPCGGFVRAVGGRRGARRHAVHGRARERAGGRGRTAPAPGTWCGRTRAQRTGRLLPGQCGDSVLQPDGHAAVRHGDGGAARLAADRRHSRAGQGGGRGELPFVPGRRCAGVRVDIHQRRHHVRDPRVLNVFTGGGPPPTAHGSTIVGSSSASARWWGRRAAPRRRLPGSTTRAPPASCSTRASPRCRARPAWWRRSRTWTPSATRSTPAAAR